MLGRFEKEAAERTETNATFGFFQLNSEVENHRADERGSVSVDFA